MIVFQHDYTPIALQRHVLKIIQLCIISCFFELIIMASVESTKVAKVWWYKSMNNSQKQNSVIFSETTRAWLLVVKSLISNATLKLQVNISSLYFHK